MTDHIESDALEDYLLGGVADPSAIEAHLDACHACAARARDAARAEDAFDALAAAAVSCPGCERLVLAERCDHCGAALRVEGYRILEVRVHNARGRLYVAEDAAGERVALKELCFVQAPGLQAVEAFEREARFLAALEHPQLPRFLASFEVGTGVHTRLYLAQQLVEGESLEARLAHHYVDEAEVVDIARQVLDILVYLQSRSPMVIHRDVKPANLVRRTDGSIVLVDFGAARDHGITEAGTTQVGTFGYMPTEQLVGIVDATTDVFALGASLIRLLTRKPPWQESSRLAVSPELRRVLHAMTERSSDDRYPTAAAALAALRRLGSRRRRRVPLALAGIAMAAGASAAGYVMLGGDPASPPASAPIEVIDAAAPIALLSRGTCAPGPVARLPLIERAVALVDAAGDEGLWTEVLGLVASYRTAAEGVVGPAPYHLRPVRAYAHRGHHQGVMGRVATRTANEFNMAHSSAFVVDGDFTAEGIWDSIVIARGDVTVSTISNSIVIAGGCVKTYRGSEGSLVVAGNLVSDVSGATLDSIVAAPRLDLGTHERTVLVDEAGTGVVWSALLAALGAANSPEDLVPAATCPPGKCALAFDSNELVTVPLRVRGRRELTVEAWVKPRTSLGGTLRLVGFFDRSRLDLVVDRWQHVAVVWDGKRERGYRDGAQVYETEALLPQSPDDGILGFNFAGVLDEVRIWDVARTATDIARDRTKKLRGTEPGLAAYYPFDEGKDEIVHDRAHGHDGWRGTVKDIDGDEPEWTTDVPPM